MRPALAIDTDRGVWLRAPCSLTQVCAVVDDTTPPHLVTALTERFGNAPQFSLLELHAPDELHAQWLASFEAEAAAPARHPVDVDRLLAPLPPGCVLALCSQAVDKLDWLGSVTGLSCRPIALHAADRAASLDDSQTAHALDAVGAIWMETLTAQFGGER
ncbi:hypothetical protein [Paraburkholderia sp. J67]|uniref:hypothetical protein n=1 Tax=Paraburkholderia sp. J67 TaxID=2805435 RepID=UPI002ABE918F|nr:hypothetical protein [Paraburkholderia sp. J67]